MKKIIISYFYFQLYWFIHFHMHLLYINHFFYIVTSFALFYNGIDKKLIGLYKSKVNFILLILIILGILYEVLKVFFTFDFILIDNNVKYFGNYLIILFFLFSLVIGVNFKKVLNFNSIFICNSIILIVFIIQIFELNYISYKICYLLDSKLFVGTNYCVSLTEGMKGFSLLTTEPSFGVMQLMFFFILNLFYLKNFDLKPYEKKILNIFLLFFTICLPLMNSELGLLFFILILFWKLWIL